MIGAMRRTALVGLLVAAGMLYQFLFHLIRFLSRRSQPTPPPIKKKPGRQNTPVPVA